MFTIFWWWIETRNHCGWASFATVVTWAGCSQADPPPFSSFPSPASPSSLPSCFTLSFLPSCSLSLFLTTVSFWEESSSAPLHTGLSHSAGLLIFGLAWTPPPPPQLPCVIFLVGNQAPFLASSPIRQLSQLKMSADITGVSLGEQGGHHWRGSTISSPGC